MKNITSIIVLTFSTVSFIVRAQPAAVKDTKHYSILRLMEDKEMKAVGPYLFFDAVVSSESLTCSTTLFGGEISQAQKHVQRGSDLSFIPGIESVSVDQIWKKISKDSCILIFKASPVAWRLNKISTDSGWSGVEARVDFESVSNLKYKNDTLFFDVDSTKWISNGTTSGTKVF